MLCLSVIGRWPRERGVCVPLFLIRLADCLLTPVVFCVCPSTVHPNINNDTIILPPLPLSLTVFLVGEAGWGTVTGMNSLPPCPPPSGKRNAL